MTASSHTRPIKPGDHLYLVDGSGYLFRAYHALPPLTRKSDGLPTGAVAGFSNMLWKLLEDMKAGDKPTHLAVIFDAGRESFRNALYPEYKANRPEAPEDLIPQFPLVREATRAFGVPAVELPGYEADDLIATYARQAREKGARVTIVSADKDLMQLVEDGRIELFDTLKNKRIGSAEVIERFGVPPDKVVHVQALAGDSTDNVPGVPGIGVKTGAELIKQYGDLETLLAHAGDIKQPKRRQVLMENADKARLTEKLVRLDDHAPVEMALEEFGVRDPEAQTLVPFLKKMEFSTLLKRAAAALGIDDVESIAAAPNGDTKAPPAILAISESGEKGTPGTPANGARYTKPLDPDAYDTVRDMEALERWIGAARETGAVAVWAEAAGPDTMRAGMAGIALATEPGAACYVPLGHRAEDGLNWGDAPAQLDAADVLEKLKPLLEDEAVLKIGHNIKALGLLLLAHGIRLHPIDDAMLISYVCAAGLHPHTLEALARQHLDHTPGVLAELLGRGKDKRTFAQVPVAEATRHAAARADIALRLHGLLKPALIAARRVTVYETLERPLVPVLTDMEAKGITIDPDVLARLSNDFARAMAELEKQLHREAGEEFNLGSPKQLGDILFGKLSLPGGRRTKTGAWSTDADILEELAAQGHEIPQLILQWRQLAKLKSTYTDALPQHIDPKTKRVHTSFALAATTTGRLSSIEPNLQNIPIRTEEGRRIRQAFVAPKGRLLVSADYSQIELRLLAHRADVPALSQAFADGVDIHALTASEMFGVPVKDMPPEVRRRAKAINFGIIYGISAFGLANQLGIPRGEADAYIKKYFERFPGIRDYMEETKAFVKKHGYVETIFGRRIHIADVNAKSAAQRAFAERQAINAPLQGSAADIIRRAMVRLPPALEAEGLDADLLLQVHDELVIEARAKDAEKVCHVARAVMEKAPLPAVQLKVPLVVEARAGANWDEAH